MATRYRPAVAYRLVADAIVVVHLGFVCFVALGGLLVRWRRGIALVHLPCAVYGAAIEVGGWICPLTPLENRLRAAAGEGGYAGGFVEHYLVRVLYPEPLTSAMQRALAVAVVLVNAGAYAWALRRPPRRR